MFEKLSKLKVVFEDREAQTKKVIWQVLDPASRIDHEEELRITVGVERPDKEKAFLLQVLEEHNSKNKTVVQEETKAKNRSISKFSMIVSLYTSDDFFQFSTPKLNRIYKNVVRGIDWDKLNLETETEQPKLIKRSKSQLVLNSAEAVMKNMMIYYRIDNLKSFKQLKAAVNYSKSLKEVLPLLYCYRAPVDILSNYEIETLPINELFTLTLWNNLKKYPEKAMNEYFGGRVSTFFSFMSFFRDWLVIPALLGLVYMGVEVFYSSNEEYDTSNGPVEKLYEVCSFIYLFVISITKNMFLYKWKKHESSLAANEDYDEYTETTQGQRKGFKPIMIRSLVTDKINLTAMNEDKGGLIESLIYLITTVIIILSFVVARVIMNLKRNTHSLGSIPDVVVWYTGTKLLSALFGFVEFFRIMLFQYLYFTLIRKMLRWRNFKYIRTYETNLIIFTSVYQIINNSAALLLLYFDQLISNYGINSTGVLGLNSLTCTDGDCYAELSSYFSSFIIIQLIWSFGFKFIFKVVIIKIVKKANQKTRELMKTAISKLNQGLMSKDKNTPKRSTDLVKLVKDLDNNTEVGGLLQEPSDIAQDRLVATCYEKQHQIYEEINKEIEKQVVELEDYSKTEDYDATLEDYLSIVNNFGLIVLFGAVYSQCYITSGLIACSEAYLTRNNLLFLKKRPVPSQIYSIGIWYDVMEVTCYMAVPLSAVYGSWFIYEDRPTGIRTITFLVIMFLFGFIDLIFYRMRSKRSFSRTKITDRVEFIESNLFSVTKDTKVVDIKNIKQSNKIFNSNNNMKKKVDVTELADEAEEERVEKEKEGEELKKMDDIANRALKRGKME